MKQVSIQLFIVSICCQLPLLLEAQEAEHSIEEEFRRGLFAEEVDSDLETAKAAYTEVLEQFDEQKKMAATAAYRLAEVYRKLAITDSSKNYDDLAAQQYERVIREFPEVDALAKLSRGNLAAMGRPTDEPGGPSPTDEESKIIAQLKRWKETSPDKLNELPTPLYQAAKDNQLRVAEYLISQSVELERDLLPPLTAAAGEGHLSMVELLLKAGADPRPKGKFPPIHQALINDRMAVVKKLIEVGAHLNFEDHKEGPPLQFISNINKWNLKMVKKIDIPEDRLVEYAELLIDAGAAVDEIDQRAGKTPLFVAVENRFEGIVSLLLESGADVNRVQSKPKTTPLIQAVQSSRTFRVLDMIKLLLAAGSEVDQTDEKGFTALHHCVLERLPLEYVETLLEAGADATRSVGKNGWTPLHFWALHSNDDRIARALYRAGGNPIALADSFPAIDESIPKVSNNTPLGILYQTGSETKAITREFYEHGIQTLPTEEFAGKVWFAMPTEPDEVIDEIAAMSPTDLIANIFPVFREGETAWAAQGPDSSQDSLSPPGLAELITEVYNSRRFRGTNNRPRTPNLEKLRILRPVNPLDEKSRWNIVTVFFKDMVAAAEEDGDFPLQWGDVVLFDQLESNRPSSWYQFRFKDEAIDTDVLQKAATLQVKLTLGEISSNISIAPRSEGSLAEAVGDLRFPNRYHKFSSPSSLHNLEEYTRYRDDLDLSLATVIRTVQGQPEKIPVPLDTFDEDSDFFLKDGDHVIIPRKPDIAVLMPADRKSAIWISNPANHLLKTAYRRSSFADRPVTGLSLARSIAQFYASSRELIPFPDFSKVQLWKPGNKSPETVQLFPPENNRAEMLIPWGTIIEIPIEKGKNPQDWLGLSDEQRDFLQDSTKLTITIQPEGQAPKVMTAKFTFPGYKRSSSGVLIEAYGSTTPNFWDLLGNEFRGEDVKWDSNRFVLEADGKTWNYTSGHRLSAFLDGDILKIFRKL